MREIDKYPGIKEALDEAQEKIQMILELPVTVNYALVVHKPPTLDMVMQMISEVTNVSVAMIKSDVRETKYVIARQLFCWYAVTWCKYTMVKVGLFLGKDHTTVVHSRNKVNDMIQTGDVEYKALINQMSEKISVK